MTGAHWRRRVDERLDGEGTASAPGRRSTRRQAKPTPPAPDAPAGQAPPQPPRPPDAPAGAETGPTPVRREEQAKGPGAEKRPPAPAEPEPPLVPPTVEPPRLPDFDEETDHPRSVRAWVLVACFAWGVLLGFLYQVTKEEEPEALPPASSAAAETDGDAGAEAPAPDPDGSEDGGDGGPTPAARRRAAALPETGSGPRTEEVLRDLARTVPTDGGAPALADTEAWQYHPRLPKRPYGGLSGQNAPLPPFAPAADGRGGPDALRPDLPVGPEEAAPDLDIELDF